MTDKCDIQELARAIGRRVQTRRKALGLTQERLAERVDLSPTYIAKLEAGDKTPSLRTILGLASALDLDPADLVRRSDRHDDNERARNLAVALSGLPTEDMAFVEQEILHLVSHLRGRR